MIPLIRMSMGLEKLFAEKGLIAGGTKLCHGDGETMDFGQVVENAASPIKCSLAIGTAVNSATFRILK